MQAVFACMELPPNSGVVFCGVDLAGLSPSGYTAVCCGSSVDGSVKNGSALLLVLSCLRLGSCLLVLRSRYRYTPAVVFVCLTTKSTPPGCCVLHARAVVVFGSVRVGFASVNARERMCSSLE